MTEPLSNFRNLDAWQAARRLVKSIYDFTDQFPQHERYCLTQQMRKAVHSVHSNIAEGTGRLSNGEWQQFLGQARGSLMEVESDVIAAFDLKYCSDAEVAAVGKQIQKAAQLVNGLLRKSMHPTFKNKKYKPVEPANGKRQTANG
jgi:four helix bundle protein